MKASGINLWLIHEWIHIHEHTLIWTCVHMNLYTTKVTEDLLNKPETSFDYRLIQGFLP